jgi:hypothetical protein
MGTSATSAELARKLNTAATNLGQAQTRRRSVKAAADVAADIYNDQAGKAGLSIGSNLAGRPWRGYTTKQRDDDSVVIYTNGPVHLHNNPTNKHWIFPKGERTNVAASGPVLPGMARPIAQQGGRRRRNAGGESLRFKGRHASWGLHKGTTGKRWASKAVAVIERNAPEAYQKEQSSVWRAVFK